eukprot:comp116191_c0_seq1/m.48956 comp116191_c0_seq1/g.48956  ORF comp116191_c0_seq1/g.48956 comp116191_c0_seq1/m.48956 type:complete len:213 (-) comp116191_c0_seq1:219-857(-)
MQFSRNLLSNAHGFNIISPLAHAARVRAPLVVPVRWVSENRRLYGILGLTPKATNAEIKRAYVELSKEHHPDKNDGSLESHDRFSEISEAYNILGNYETRRRYDHAMGHGVAVAADPNRVGKRMDVQFNFDEHARRHYERRKQQQASAKDREKHAEAEWNQRHNRAMILTSLAVVVIGWWVLVVRHHADTTGNRRRGMFARNREDAQANTVQ